jgi:hypothetical protein
MYLMYCVLFGSKAKLRIGSILFDIMCGEISLMTSPSKIVEKYGDKPICLLVVRRSEGLSGLVNIII